MDKIRVFLGGTCNGSNWREKLIPLLNIDYFNPVVEDWTPECQEEERRQRVECDYCLYVLTPKMTGAYAVAEAVDDSNKRPYKTIFCFLKEDEEAEFTSAQIKSMEQIGRLISSNRGLWLSNLEDIAEWLNEATMEGENN